MDVTGEGYLERSSLVERTTVGIPIQTASEQSTLHAEKTFAPTTFLTRTIHQHTGGSSHLTDVTGGAVPNESGEQLNLSKAQLVVAILILVGVGKLVETLGKKAWKAVVSFLSKGSQTIEEPNESIVEPHPLVQEHPAGPPPGNISEEEEQDFAISTQPRSAAGE